MMFCVAAVKAIVSTKDATQKQVERELSVWFGNSRDRGDGGRLQPRARVTATTTADDSTNI
jgi:hypothetical protein